MRQAKVMYVMIDQLRFTELLASRNQGLDLTFIIPTKFVHVIS